MNAQQAKQAAEALLDYTKKRGGMKAGYVTSADAPAIAQAYLDALNLLEKTLDQTEVEWTHNAICDFLNGTEATKRRPISDVAGAWAHLDDDTKESIRQELREMRE